MKLPMKKTCTSRGPDLGRDSELATSPGFQHDQCLRSNDAAARSQSIHHLLEIMNSVHPDAHDRIGIACDRDDFLDFRNLGRELQDMCQVKITGEPQLGDGLNSYVESGVIDDRRIAGDNSLLLQTCDAPIDRSHREVHAFGDVAHRAAAVFLQQVENLSINGIDRDELCHVSSLLRTTS